jgi:hypothetical protein
VPVERPLTTEEQEELDGLFTLALGFLPIVTDADEAPDPALLIGALHLLLEEARAGRLAAVPADDLATYGGVLWGDELCRLKQWEWCYLTIEEGGLEGAAVVTPDRALAVLPIHLIYRWLSRPSAPNDCQPLFDRLVRQEVAAPPGEYLLVG